MLLDPHQSRLALRTALEHRFALLAVNADSPSAVYDVLEAARRCDAPVIIETSLWQLQGRSFGAGDAALGLARYLADLAVLAGSERFAGVPVLFHTDHVKGPVTVPLLTAAVRGLAIDFGGRTALLAPSTVSLDSSELSEEENLRILRLLADAAEEAGRPLTLEVEAGVDDGITPLETARDLIGGIERTHPGRVWLWAPGVGTRHGLDGGEMPAFDPRAVASHRELAGDLTGRPIGIALHGSSGLPETALGEAVAAGVTKVNWSSESLLLRAQAARDYYRGQGDQLEKGRPRFKTTAMDNGLQSFIAERYLPAVEARIRILGGAGRARLVREALAVLPA